MARRKIWTPTNTGTTVAAGSSASLDLLAQLPLDLEGVGGVTVTRIIGNLSFRCDNVGVYQQFAAGIVVHHEDLNVGNLDLATEGDPGVMWTWLGRTNGAFIEVASGNFDAVEERVYIDVRVQRKVAQNHRVDFVIENGSGQTILFNLGVRVLIALP